MKPAQAPPTPGRVPLVLAVALVAACEGDQPAAPPEVDPAPRTALTADALELDEPDFDVIRARTEAGVIEVAGASPLVRLAVVAELAGAVPPDDSYDGVVVTWERAGGIEPQPFRLSIPAGCLEGAVAPVGPESDAGAGTVASDCGATATVGDLRYGVGEFEARLASGEARAVLEVEADLFPPDPVYPPDPIRLLMDVLGGSALVLQLGELHSGFVLPRGIETLSGVQPEPF